MARMTRSNSSRSTAICLPPPSSGERVIARASVVFRRAPLSLHPPFEEQALERRVPPAFSDLKHLPRKRLDPLSDAVTMHLAGCQRSKD